MSFQRWISTLFHLIIFTMVSYFLRWTLLKFFSSFSDEQSQQKVRRLGRITRVVINTSNEVKCPLLWEFWINNFSWRILKRVLVGNIVNIRNECLFFWVHGGMNRSAEQTNHPRTASRFTRFVCSRYDSYPHEPRKKDTHSLICLLGRRLLSSTKRPSKSRTSLSYLYIPTDICFSEPLCVLFTIC